MKPKIYFLIGPPAVGKSTWIETNKRNSTLSKDTVTINRDEMVEKIAKDSGIGNYDEMFSKPPKNITPSNTPTKEDLLDSSKEDEINNYLENIKKIAEDYNKNNPEIVTKYGELIPFNRDSLETVIVKYGVKPEYVIPFEYSKIKSANNDVSNLLNNTRKESSINKKDIIIDMTNMSVGERNGHRKFLVASIENIDEKEADPIRLSDYYDQYAIVFSPKEGYTPEIIENIKKIAAKRADEIKAKGGSKTIPSSVYDMMFSKYQTPTEDEGFVKIDYVGVPSLSRLNEKYLKSYESFCLERITR